MSAQPPALTVALSGALGAFTLDAAFEVPKGGITALFGPSGSGKTTILRCIAGLQHLPGRISVGTECWQDSDARIFVAPHRRHVGYVFQEPSLFPHLSVRRNLMYGAARATDRKAGFVSPDATRIGLDEVVDLLGISHLLHRDTTALSGGERQRVAVGRALLSNPQLLLMDEPLSALDRATKDEVLPYFDALHARLAIPILYVSHDMAEVERLADRLVLIEDGRVRASGALTDVLVDAGLGVPRGSRCEGVSLTGCITSYDVAYDLTEFAVAGGTLLVPGRHGDVGEIRRLRIGVDDVSFSLIPGVASSVLNCLPARIVAVERRAVNAGVATVTAALGVAGEGAHVTASVAAKAMDRLALAPGMTVMAGVRAVVG